MNCKPGDVAVVIRDLHLLGAVIVRSGQVVKVLRLMPANHGTGQVWEIEEPIPYTLTFPLPSLGVVVGAGGQVVGIDDSDLRPLRGNGVTDEEVRELFAPAPVTEVAA